MPELPEVESIRRALHGQLVGATVRGVSVLRRDVIVGLGDPQGGFSRQRSERSASNAATSPTALRPGDLLDGFIIDRLERRGKQLAIIGRLPKPSPPRIAERALVVQLGMTGQLLLGEAPSNPRSLAHVHIRWDLAPAKSRTAHTLLFRDPRRFGGVRIFESSDALYEHWATALGPDALSITPEHLARSLTDSQRAIKAALLDQAVLAGVGNIYADEALFRAGISPRRLAAKVRASEAEPLAESIRAVLEHAILRGGSTLRDYVTPDGQPGTYQLAHNVYGRAGQPCPRCGGKLKSATIAQRTTTWCPNCQR